jgi:hypothetical protein
MAEPAPKKKKRRKKGKGERRCPHCGGRRLSPEVDYASFQDHARFKDWSMGLLQGKDLAVGPSRARICLRCGFMMLFASREHVAELNDPPEGWQP